MEPAQKKVKTEPPAKDAEKKKADTTPAPSYYNSFKVQVRIQNIATQMESVLKVLPDEKANQVLDDIELLLIKATIDNLNRKMETLQKRKRTE
jgi:hypothetical protein